MALPGYQSNPDNAGSAGREALEHERIVTGDYEPGGPGERGHPLLGPQVRKRVERLRDGTVAVQVLVEIEVVRCDDAGRARPKRTYWDANVCFPPVKTVCRE